MIHSINYLHSDVITLLIYIRVVLHTVHNVINLITTSVWFLRISRTIAMDS